MTNTLSHVEAAFTAVELANIAIENCEEHLANLVYERDAAFEVSRDADQAMHSARTRDSYECAADDAERAERVWIDLCDAVRAMAVQLADAIEARRVAEETQRATYRADVLADVAAAEVAYRAYVAACDAEECEPHGYLLWNVYGSPTGPLG